MQNLGQHLSTAAPFVVFAVGACVGSFLGVCIERIPKGESIIFPGSRCRCGVRIPWRLNIPLVSWCWLRGRARCCGSPIPARCFFLELLTALLFLALWSLNHSPQEWFVNVFLASLLIVVSCVDLDTMEIPDSLSLGGLLAGLAAALLCPRVLLSPHAGPLGCFMAAFQGAMLGSALLLWIAIVGEKCCGREALGFGDVKLMGCIGAFLGTRGAVFAIFGGSFLGVLILLPYMLYSRCRHGRSWSRTTKIPFGPFLALGAISYLLGAQRIVDHYLGRCSLRGSW